MADRPSAEILIKQGQGSKRKATSTSDLATKTSNQPFKSSPNAAPNLINTPRTFQIPSLPYPPRTSTNAAKVAIPRLRRPSDTRSAAGSIKSGDKHRVNHACEPCRHRKTKCSGEVPVCKHCEDFNIQCVYADGKRDRVKKEIGQMSSKIDVYEQILQDISSQLDPAIQARIRRALEKVSYNSTYFPTPPMLTRDKDTTTDEDETQSVVSSKRSAAMYAGSKAKAGEEHVSAEVGSTGSLDQIKEDFNRTDDAKATGFMGKVSEVTWMHRLRSKAENGSSIGADDAEAEDEEGLQNGLGLYPNPNQSNAPGGDQSARNSQPLDGDGLVDSTYHCDDIAMLQPDQVDPFELPPRQTAEFLLSTFVDTVHPSFPIIGKLNFAKQMQNLFDDAQSRPGRNWLAILNFVFAIAAKYSHLVQAEGRGDERDHLIYFTRGRVLGMEGEGILAQPDLQRVQVTGLMAFYLMSVNQINRSWTVCGVSLRYCVALGLHLRNENPKLSEPNKEIRYRVWWAVYCLERNLGVMTGRPTSVADLDCVTPAPLPIDEEAFSNPNNAMQNSEVVRRMRRHSSQDSPRPLSTPSSIPSPRTRTSPTVSHSPSSQQSGTEGFNKSQPSTSLYFLNHVHLSTLTNEVLTNLYRPAVMTTAWSTVQSKIGSLDSKLEAWRNNLPPAFDFTKKLRNRQFARHRMSLGFLYYGTRITINRPCLCRVNRHIAHASSRSRDFNQQAACNCVQAAQNMLDLIPDEPNPIGLYTVGPWWGLTHHLMQAATVLMLELFYRAEHLPNTVDAILAAAKKATYWLNQMSRESLAAHRAWVHCNAMLRKVAPRVGRSAEDMPVDTPRSVAAAANANPPRPIFNHDVSRDINNDNWGGHQAFMRRFPDQHFYGGPAPETDATFHPPMYTSYDEYLSFDTSMPPASSASALQPAGTGGGSYYPGSAPMEAFTTAPMQAFTTAPPTGHVVGGFVGELGYWDSLGLQNGLPLGMQDRDMEG